MKALLKLFTKPWFLGLVALALGAFIIWYGGPYLAFGNVRPLDGAVARLVAILVMVVAWTLWVQVKQLRAQRAGDQLVREVTKQAPGKEAALGSAEAAQLRARFEEAIGTLRGAKGRAANLYELPWYMIIGPPGAGKTTAIANSGLNFPLAKQYGREALRGIGGTRNCDWWITSEAILLDTAGRYTTQDSDAQSDHAGWLEFLSLLRKHRGRRPVNGVIVALSSTDLIGASQSDRRRHVEAIRRRLEELSRELRVSLPVYLFITKLDLVAGFTEFFDDLNQEGRAQVWGTTFDLDQSRSGQAAHLLAGELDQLLERLNARQMLRIEAERDVQRRGLIFTFPRQLAALRRPLTELVTEVFNTGEFAGRMQLRGFYLTSGAQEGTPVDRMMGALARTFGLNMQGAVVQPAQGRAYFIQRLLKEVLFKESGLAGVNRKVEVRHALIQGAAYAGIAAVALIGLIALSMSYGRNRSYLDEVTDAAELLRQAPQADASSSLTGDLPRLDALESLERVARRHENDVPFSMRWGLFQGHSMRNAVNDAYVRELNARLLPAVADHFRSRLVNFAGEPDKLYEYLKAYLMLGLPEHLDPVQLGFLGNLEWRRAFVNDPATSERVSAHFGALIEDSSRVQPASLDEVTVQSARTSLRQASLPVLIYSRLKLAHAGDTARALDIATETGLGANAVFVSRSGTGLSEPVPALYTRPVFDEIATKGKLDVVSQFVSESWVLGEGVADLRQAPRLAAEVMNLYEDDYIREWDALLADLTLRKASGTQEAADLWGLLAAPTSPLKRLLVLVEAHTNLLKPADESDAADKAQKAVAGKLDALGKIFGSNDAPAATAPGTKVTNHFAPMHKLVTPNSGGAPAPIDLTLQKFANVQSTLAQINALGGTPPLQLATQLSLAVKDLETHAKTLPGPFEGLVSRTAGQGNVVAKASIGSDFNARYRQQVAAECLALAAGRYPLTPGSKDLPLADFGRLFGGNGVFETFFDTTMRSFVDTNRATWAWKREAASLGGSASVPTQFQRADRIKQIFFPPGGSQPEVRFTLAPSSLDAAVSRLVVEVDGQTLEYRHGPVRAVPMTWPGPSPGQAVISFEERGGGGPNLVTQGPWALYRLLEQATIQPQSDTTFLVTFDLNGRSARLVLQAASSRNPFGRNVLHGFACTH